MAKESRLMRCIRKLPVSNVSEDVPILGPLFHGRPGREPTLISSAIIPLSVAVAEVGLAIVLHQITQDMTPFVIATIGLQTVARVVEAKTLEKRKWSANIFTVGVADTLDLVEKKVISPKLESMGMQKASEFIKKLSHNPWTITFLAKFLALTSFLPNYPVAAASIQENDPSKILALLTTQNLGEMAFMVLHMVELLRPRTFVKDQ